MGYGPSPPLAVQDLGSQGSRPVVAAEVAEKPGTVVLVVGATVVLVEPLWAGLVVVVVVLVGAGAWTWK